MGFRSTFTERTLVTPIPGHVCSHSRLLGMKIRLQNMALTAQCKLDCSAEMMDPNLRTGMNDIWETCFGEEVAARFDDRRGEDVNNRGGFMPVWLKK